MIRLFRMKCNCGDILFCYYSSFVYLNRSCVWNVLIPGSQLQWWCPSRNWEQRLRQPSWGSPHRQRMQRAWAQSRRSGPTQGAIAPWNKQGSWIWGKWGRGKVTRRASSQSQKPPRHSGRSTSPGWTPVGEVNIFRHGSVLKHALRGLIDVAC